MSLFQWVTILVPSVLQTTASPWQAELGAINAGCSGGNCGAPAMRTAAPIHLLALRTPHYFVTHTNPEDFPKFLGAWEKELTAYNVYDWAWQLKAMLGHNIYKAYGLSAENAAAAVRARVLVITSQQDHMVNPEPAREFAQLLKAETMELTGDCGHLAFLCEEEMLRAAVMRFLNQK